MEDGILDCFAIARNDVAPKLQCVIANGVKQSRKYSKAISN